MTDSHCHLTYPPLGDKVIEELEHFTQNSGKHLLNVGAKLEDIQEIIQQKRRVQKLFPGVVKIAFGIHPEHLTELTIEQINENLNKLESEIDKHKNELSAVGECGLDYYHTESHPNLAEIKEHQKLALRRQIKKALQNKLPITFHNREPSGEEECIQDILTIIAQEGEGKVQGSMHSYTGSEKYVEQILDLGLHIGFNAIITYKSGLPVRDFVKKVPLDKILLETDAPWLPIRGKQFPSYGCPSNVVEVAKVIAEIHHTSLEKVLDATTENFEALFC